MEQKKSSRRNFLSSFFENTLVKILFLGTLGVSVGKNVEQYSTITDLEDKLNEANSKLTTADSELSTVKSDLESEAKKLKSKMLFYFDESKDPSRVVLSIEDDKTSAFIPLTRNEFSDYVLMGKPSGIPYTLRYEVFDKEKSRIEIGVYRLNDSWSDIKNPTDKVGYLVFGIHSKTGEYMGSEELLKILNKA